MAAQDEKVQADDVETNVKELRILNITQSTISVMVKTDKCTITEDQIKAVSDYNETSKISGNAEVGIDGMGKIGAGGSKEESKSNNEQFEQYRKYANELQEAGWQDVANGDIIKISVQSISSLQYVSIFYDGKLIRNNWPIIDKEVIVLPDGEVISNPNLTLTRSIPAPSQATLYQPIYGEFIKECLKAFKGLYDIGTQNKDILTTDLIKTIVQRSVEFRSVNNATMKLLNMVKTRWMSEKVKSLYNSASKAEIFERNYELNVALLKQIVEEAGTISSCFIIAGEWYYKLEGHLTSLETGVFAAAENDIDHILDSLKSIMDDNFNDKDIESEYQKVAAMPPQKGETANDGEVQAKIGKLQDLREDIMSKLQYKLADKIDEVKKAKHQMELSAISFIGGPVVGALVTGGFGINYEVRKGELNSLRDGISKGMKEATKDAATARIVGQVSSLASDVGQLGSFCKLMGAWFQDQVTVFQTWGQSKQKDIGAIDKSYLEWDVDAFLNALKDDAAGNQYWVKYNENIRKALSAIDGWTGAQFDDKDFDVFTTFAWVNNDKTDAQGLLDWIHNQMKKGSTENQPWKFWDVNYFVSWLNVQNDAKYMKYSETVKSYLSNQKEVWNGSKLDGIDVSEIKQWGIDNEADQYGIFASITTLINSKGAKVPVNYFFWERDTYDNDVAFIHKSISDCEQLIKTLQRLDVDFAIVPDDDALKATTPDKSDYPEIAIDDAYDFSVQKESATFT